MKVSVFLLVLTRSTTAWPGTPKMKNIGYLGSGYDFMFGNPHALGTVDPGFRDSLIDYVYMGQKTADDEYVIPNGINIRRCDACRLDWETNEVFGMNSYEHSLIDDATSIFKFLGFFSKASKDYSQVEKETTQFQRVVTESKASCLVYCADLVKTPGAFGVSPLKAALQTLPEKLRHPRNDRGQNGWNIWSAKRYRKDEILGHARAWNEHQAVGRVFGVSDCQDRITQLKC